LAGRRRLPDRRSCGCEHDGREQELGEDAMHYGIDQSRSIGPDNPVAN
jgi:hypothetical protein